LWRAIFGQVGQVGNLGLSGQSAKWQYSLSPMGLLLAEAASTDAPSAPRGSQMRVIGPFSRPVRGAIFVFTE
jgi:hypothetical protein